MRPGWINRKASEEAVRLDQKDKIVLQVSFRKGRRAPGRTGDVALGGARSAMAAEFAGQKFVSHPPSPALRTWHVDMWVTGRHGELRGHGVRGLDDQGVCLKEE